MSHIQVVGGGVGLVRSNSGWLVEWHVELVMQKTIETPDAVESVSDSCWP